jgi:hypothetical protein
MHSCLMSFQISDSFNVMTAIATPNLTRSFLILAPVLFSRNVDHSVKVPRIEFQANTRSHQSLPLNRRIELRVNCLSYVY